MKSTGLGNFLLSLAVIILAAIFFPEPGATGGFLRSEILIKVGIFIIFFFQGALLPVSEVKKGFLQWKVNLTTILLISLITPLLGWLLLLPLKNILTPDIYLGAVFLCFLPTTLSTAVVFTTLAGGAVVVALFSTAFSNILGILLVPLLTTLLLATSQTEGISIAPLLIDISKILLLPLLIGNLSRFFIGDLIQQNRKHVGRINSWIILFTLYAAFCNSIAGGVWATYGWQAGAEALLLALALHFIFLTLTIVLFFRVMRLSNENAIAGVFCSSQKTIAAGIPFATTIVAGLPPGSAAPELGLFILPLMIYHPLQMLVGTFLIERFKKLPST